MPGEVDTLHRVETPENIDIQAECAGPVSRCLAYSIDLSLRGLLMALLGLASVLLDKAGTGLLLLGWFALNWFYPVLFEVLRQGQTPGKRVLGLYVVHRDLSPIGWNASLIRNLLRTVDFLPAGYLLGLFSMCMTPQFQRLGDLAAGTLVIYRNQLPTASALPGVPSAISPIPLDLDEQVELVNFARRSEQLSDGRKNELVDY